MCDDEVVASCGPPRSLFEMHLLFLQQRPKFVVTFVLSDLSARSLPIWKTIIHPPPPPPSLPPPRMLRTMTRMATTATMILGPRLLRLPRRQDRGVQRHRPKLHPVRSTNTVPPRRDPRIPRAMLGAIRGGRNQPRRSASGPNNTDAHVVLTFLSICKYTCKHTTRTYVDRYWLAFLFLIRTCTCN